MNDELDWILARVASGELSPEAAEPLVATVTGGAPPVRATIDPDDPIDPDAPTRTWQAFEARRSPGASTTPAPGPASRAASRAVRIQVTDGGRDVVSLCVPMSLASLVGSVIPGLGDAQVARLRQALRDGEVGTILDVRDTKGSGVLISTE